MRKIAIIGAGQAGLLLAIGLKKNGYDVSLYSNRTKKQIVDGYIMSNQAMFDSSLKIERLLGLDFWGEICPQNTTITFTLTDPTIANKKAIYWQGLTHKPYQSIDQRLKFSRWMDEFEQQGGNLIIQDVQKNDLEKISKEYALTILSTGKGDLGIFQRNDELSTFLKPQRFLACLYVKGVTPVSNAPGVRVNIIPGVGEYFIMPGLTINGNCEMMLFEGVPGGSFDCWRNLTSIDQQLEISLQLLKKYLPWEAERCIHVEPADQKASLTGGYIPYVKHPVFKLPSGRLILGLGDTVVLNDPIAGQGANNACKAAGTYLQSIKQRGNNPFDESWMNDTFYKYWQTCAKWATQWSNMLLTPPPSYVINLLKSASNNANIANVLANAFDEPNTLFPWITSEDQTTLFITKNYRAENSIDYPISTHIIEEI